MEETTKIIGELDTNGLVDVISFMGFIVLVGLCMLAIFFTIEYGVITFSKNED